MESSSNSSHKEDGQSLAQKEQRWWHESSIYRTYYTDAPFVENETHRQYLIQEGKPPFTEEYWRGRWDKWNNPDPSEMEAWCDHFWISRKNWISDDGRMLVEPHFRARMVEARSQAERESLFHFTKHFKAGLPRPYFRPRRCFLALSGPLDSLQKIREHIQRQDEPDGRREPRYIGDVRDIEMIGWRQFPGLFRGGEIFKACELDRDSLHYIVIFIDRSREWFGTEHIDCWVDGRREWIILVMRRDEITDRQWDEAMREDEKDPRWQNVN